MEAELFQNLPEGSPILRLSTAGSVDDGKSTLIGRLLLDAKGVFEDQVMAAKVAADKKDSSMMLSLLTDGLKAEREQGITIDVAYRYFSTEKRRFILADTPGHEQYTRNMATGASTADATIVLVDATKGILTQTKRHSCIAALLGVPRLIVAINKMDLVSFSEARFRELVKEFEDFAPRLNVKNLSFFPVAALSGDNIVTQSSNMPWYHGMPLLEHLENIYLGADLNQIDFRFPIQYVIRSGNDYRAYAGQILSGTISAGEEVVAVPSQQRSKIAAIERVKSTMELEALPKAHAGMSVSISLTDHVDLSRGDMLVRARNQPKVTSKLDLMLVWMSDETLDPKKQYIFFHGTKKVQGYIDEILYKLDVNSLSRLDPSLLKLNEIGRVSATLKSEIAVDKYSQNRLNGSLIIIDPDSYQTVAAAMVLDRESQDLKGELSKRVLHEEKGLITREHRESRFGAKAMTFWFTGLSGSGKSSLATALESRLHSQGKAVYRLDGDNLRLGLNRDLGFTAAERTENIRRVAEVAKLFNDAGVTVLCSFISPLKVDRQKAKEIIGTESFLEVFVNAPLEVCEQRDPHGMYAKARAGLIKNFTGISAPYEAPEECELSLETGKLDLETCLKLLENLYHSKS
jgi:bifunctional enzyme CysN/CysC